MHLRRLFNPPKTTCAILKGDRAPEKFQRPDAAIKDWKAKGLKEPAKQSQWVRINDKYVEVQTTNGQITDITPVKK